MLLVCFVLVGVVGSVVCGVNLLVGFVGVTGGCLGLVVVIFGIMVY